MEDRTLWNRIKKEEKSALRQLHDKYFHQMYLYAKRYTNGQTMLSEDLVFDCFIKLWEFRQKIEIKTSVKHYLFLMLRNSIIDHHRKKRLFTEPLASGYTAPGEEKEFDDQKKYALLYASLEQLPPQRRKILEMAVFDSMTYNQIAEKMHISRNTVKTHIARAYRFLKERLDPKDFNLFLVTKSTTSRKNYYKTGHL